MSDRACPACGVPSTASFHTMEGVPANSCLLLESRTEATDFPRGRLALAHCDACGFVWNVAFDPELTEYSDRYEETQAYSARFVDFGRSLAEDWVERHDLHGADVVEIGCGKGEFLAWMAETGIRHGLGIDPGVHPERLSDEALAKLDFDADFYGARHAELRPDAVVCRHTLEHIGPVRDFLLELRANLGDALDTSVLFELPDSMRVLEEGAFWDTYHEHCSYFTPGSLVRLFTATGFDVDLVELAYDDQYILLEAHPAAGDVGSDLTGIDDDRERIEIAVETFRREVTETLSHWRDEILAVHERGGTVVLWGGGSKAVAFLTGVGLGDEVAGAVDINPHKHGRFIAGTGHRVLAPAELPGVRPELVIAMNRIYLGEIRRDLTELGLADARLVAV